MTRGEAVLSPDGKYRYRLSRHWDNGAEATFIMLNPSTADAMADDPTIRKCVGFARHWDMGGLYVGNLFAVRATDPDDMKRASDPIGPADNYEHLSWMCERAAKNGGVVICAWGTKGAYLQQELTVLGWLDKWNIVPKCLGLTKHGAPKHPLYVPYTAHLTRFP